MNVSGGKVSSLFLEGRLRKELVAQLVRERLCGCSSAELSEPPGGCLALDVRAQLWVLEQMEELRNEVTAMLAQVWADMPGTEWIGMGSNWGRHSLPTLGSSTATCDDAEVIL